MLLARKVGLDAFGQIMLANYIAILIGVAVNFGTGQSAVKTVANAKNDHLVLSEIICGIALLRISVFMLFLVSFLVYWLIAPGNYFLLFAIPLVLAEVLNPLVIYLGKEELSRYNIANLCAKLIILALVIFFINRPGQAVWVNFILGTVHTAIYLYLTLFVIIKEKLKPVLPGLSSMTQLVKENFYVLGNNFSVTLQQSLMVFALGKWGNPAWLGPYSLCDKIAWSGRLLIISVCNSIYPRGSVLFNENTHLFRLFKKRIRNLLFIGFASLSLALFLFASPIIHVMAGHPDPTAVYLLRVTAFLQVVAALNSFNVIELLIRNQNGYIFNIALILLAIALFLSIGIALYGNLFMLGAYAILVELAALIMYEYVIRTRISRLN
jgi:O-antigen/teichoic acid export membrane protein